MAPIQFYAVPNSGNLQCSICLETDGDFIAHQDAVEKIQHFFHRTCLVASAILRRERKCPLCNKEFDIKTVMSQSDLNALVRDLFLRTNAAILKIIRNGVVLSSMTSFCCLASTRLGVNLIARKIVPEGDIANAVMGLSSALLAYKLQQYMAKFLHKMSIRVSNLRTIPTKNPILQNLPNIHVDHFNQHWHIKLQLPSVLSKNAMWVHAIASATAWIFENALKFRFDHASSLRLTLSSQATTHLFIGLAMLVKPPATFKIKNRSLPSV